jgi:hypothetical protein
MNVSRETADPCDVINLRSEVISTGAQSVESCSVCGCPVVVAEGAMGRHEGRIHIPRSAVKPGVNVQRLERSW